MARDPRLLAAILCTIVLLPLGSSAASAAPALPTLTHLAAADGDDEKGDGEEEEEEQVANPLDVAIPYFGELETKFSDGWTLLNCADLTVPEPVVFTCTPESMSFATPSYDPDFGEVVLPAEMSNAGRVVTVHYTVTLALPAIPTAAELVVNMPISAGTPFSIAHAELGVICEGCRDRNARLEVLGVEPATAGTLLVTDTHLVFASAPGYRGEVALAYRVQDERDQWSEPIAITAYVSAPAADVLLPLHLRIPLPDEQIELSTDQLVVVDDADTELDLLDCGAPVYGTVTCVDGVISYTPPVPLVNEDGESVQIAADQFTATVYAESGDQVRATVTLVLDDDADAPGLVTGLLSTSAESLIPNPVPVTEQNAPAGATPSLFAPIVGLLERRQK